MGLADIDHVLSIIDRLVKDFRLGLRGVVVFHVPGVSGAVCSGAARARGVAQAIELSYLKDMERNELARAIYRTSHLTGLCRLSSGIAASEDSDKYLFASDPALLCAIAECLGAEAIA